MCLSETGFLWVNISFLPTLSLMFIHVWWSCEVMFHFSCLHYSLACLSPEVWPHIMVVELRWQICYWHKRMDFISYSSRWPQTKRSTRLCLCVARRKVRNTKQQWGSWCVCLCVCGWVGVRTFRSQFHPILSILGGTVSERAPFRDAIIAQAAQGLRRQMLPYIKVLLINIDWSVQLEGISVPISASHIVLFM